MVVEINNTKDPAKTVIALQWENHFGSCYVKILEIRMTEQKEILINLMEERTILGRPASMPLSSHSHPKGGSSPIYEVIQCRNGRMKIVTASACLAIKRLPQTGQPLMCSTAYSYRL